MAPARAAETELSDVLPSDAAARAGAKRIHRCKLRRAHASHARRLHEQRRLNNQAGDQVGIEVGGGAAILVVTCNNLKSRIIQRLIRNDGKNLFESPLTVFDTVPCQQGIESALHFVEQYTDSTCKQQAAHCNSPHFSTGTMRPTRIEQPRLATPQRNSLMLLVSCLPVRRRSLPSPYCAMWYACRFSSLAHCSCGAQNGEATTGVRGLLHRSRVQIVPCFERCGTRAASRASRTAPAGAKAVAQTAAISQR